MHSGLREQGLVERNALAAAAHDGGQFLLAKPFRDSPFANPASFLYAHGHVVQDTYSAVKHPCGEVGADEQLEERTRAAVATAIQDSGHTDATLAKALGISRAQVGNYRSSRHTATLDTAVALARTLGLTVDQLSGAEPLPDRSPALLDLAQRLQDVAEVQQGLVAELLVAAWRLRQPEDPGDDLTEMG